MGTTQGKRYGCGYAAVMDSVDNFNKLTTEPTTAWTTQKPR